MKSGAAAGAGRRTSGIKGTAVKIGKASKLKVQTGRKRVETDGVIGCYRGCDKGGG